MKKLFGVVLVVVAALVGYNYFFGDAQEKRQSKEIIDKVKSVGKSVGVLIENEHQKLKDGKYDKVLEKLGDLYEGAREEVGNLDQKLLKKIEELEEKKEALEQESSEIEDSEKNGEDKNEIQHKKDQLNKKFEELLKESEQLLKSIDSNG